MSSMLKWALHYRAMGLSVFPVTPGEKMPLVKWAEFQKRLPNENEIKTWWGQWPEADIGCVTGAISNRFVLDVDGEAGKQSVEGRDLHDGPRVRTRKGFQCHYRMVDVGGEATTLAGVLTGVDVRGEGGYVKLPPSLCSDETRYEWLSEGQLAEAPEWLIGLLKPKDVSQAVEQHGEHWLTDIIEGVGDGERHGALLRLAGYYFNVFPGDVALAHLRSWNEKNSPPIEEAEFEEQLQDLQERFSKGQYESKFEAAPRVPEIMSVGTLTAKYSQAPRYLVPGLIPEATRTIFAGWQGRGKSFAMSDLVIEVSRKQGGGKWLGTFPVKSGPVIYIDNENSGNLISYRMKQLLTPKKIGTTDLDLHFVVGNHWKMTSQDDYQWLTEQVEMMRPVLVVVDSLASCHSLDENASKDMRLFFDDLVAPFCERYQCGFLCIDHERKDTEGVLNGGKRLRGSSAKGDAVDTILSLNEDNGQVFIEHSKSRFGRRQQPFGIEIVDVTGGVQIKTIGV